MEESPLQTIERQAAKLSLRDHIKLMKALARQLREKSETEKQGLDWSAMCGIGKGPWGTQDAQDNVNGLRKGPRMTLSDKFDPSDHHMA